jgi:hypothetical protein
MSERGRPDLNPTHLVAGGLATATATVATSYLGVAGTIIGAALMSVATTAGAAIYQYYLDRGKRRYVTIVTGEIRHRFVARKPADSGRPAEPAEEPPAGATEPERPERPEEPAKPDEPNPPDETAELTEAPVPAPDEAAGTGAGPRRPRWYVLAGAAFAIFAVVIGGITAVESLAHKPVSAMLGRSDRSGTSLGDTFGGAGGSAPTRHPVVPSSTAPASPPSTTSGAPSVVPSQPTTAPVPPPANPSAPATTRPPAPTPTTPSTQPTAP